MSLFSEFVALSAIGGKGPRQFRRGVIHSNASVIRYTIHTTIMSRNPSRREVKRIVEKKVDEKLEEYLGAPPDETSSEQLAGQGDDPEEWAYEVLNGNDVRKCNEEQLAPAEYVEQEYGVSPEECDTREEFRSRVEEAG